MNMSEDGKHEFPQWEELYQQQEIESMLWFNPELDKDLEKAPDELGLRSGSALDLGTGPGTQAMRLARRGFDVTAPDISEAAIRFTHEQIREIFGSRLSILSIKETVYQGTLDPLPRALFCTMKREG
jgi:2-polyprenyl-3-methyl-5-hydroxy-6-metoxy-1,4-benzoquinol methylase